MANSINDLYLKYVNRVGKILENDRYFQYMFEMVQNGDSTLQQTNHVLHKVVDERWLTIIEDSLDAINGIIDKPRRFITTKEEVVPVDLARKITAESVRHLSQNTQFITSNENGDIQPTRILNVSSEESYNLYENRFIYTLIQRLVTFIDKRTDVIFWSTGDERTSTLVVQNKVDDAYEEIEYKIEMTIKNKQSFAENDSENMEVFKRIDRVRRLVMALRSSAFYSLMNGCGTVRSPIQRTNLMMKDPGYRKCYNLWNFLEGYDEVGYTIDVKDTALEFDEDYLFQMYTNFINNYVVFKSLLENDRRRIDEAPPKRHRVVKPKFVKQIVEQIVEDYDVPDVDIKKVIIEQVTKAQLEAEQKKKAQEKAKAAAQKKKEAEKAKAAKVKAAEKEKAAKAAAKAKEIEKKKREAEKAKAAAAKAKAAEKEKAAKAAAKAKELEKKKREAEKAKAAAAKAKAAEKEKAAKAAAKEKEQAQKKKQEIKPKTAPRKKSSAKEDKTQAENEIAVLQQAQVTKPEENVALENNTAIEKQAEPQNDAEPENSPQPENQPAAELTQAPQPQQAVAVQAARAEQETPADQPEEKPDSWMRKLLKRNRDK